MPVRCRSCLLPPALCYCEALRSFDPGFPVVILIHGREAQKRIATGRLAHLVLQGSQLWAGYDYSEDPRVNGLLADHRYAPFVLYPGPGSLSLSEGRAGELLPAGKIPLLFVVDGTWITARKTMQRSANLAAIPRLSFTRPAPSRFRLRRQPGPHCLSTAEALREALALLRTPWSLPFPEDAPEALLEAFSAMEQRHLTLGQGRRDHRGQACLSETRSRGA